MNDSMKPIKPLGQKAYGSIGHLPGSRMGPGDHKLPVGQGDICTLTARDRHDEIWVQEKLDGSCVSVANIGGKLVALGRSGYEAKTSKYLQHQFFADWVAQNVGLFDFLMAGERVVGEWLAQAHGTRYELKHGPFVAFDIMRGHERFTYQRFRYAIRGRLPTPTLISTGPTSIETVLDRIALSCHGALDPVEGAVWRVERKGKVDFLAKYVRPEKKDGCYLPEISGTEAIWNWRPEALSAPGGDI